MAFRSIFALGCQCYFSLNFQFNLPIFKILRLSLISGIAVKYLPVIEFQSISTIYYKHLISTVKVIYSLLLVILNLNDQYNSFLNSQIIYVNWGILVWVSFYLKNVWVFLLNAKFYFLGSFKSGFSAYGHGTVTE